MTRFYGNCTTCSRLLAVEVEALTEKALLGPLINVVCQHHIPVADIQLVNELAMPAEHRHYFEARLSTE